MMCGMRLLTAMVVIVVSTFCVQEGSAAWDPDNNCIWDEGLTPTAIPEATAGDAAHANTSSAEDCKLICQESTDGCESIVYDANTTTCHEYNKTLGLSTADNETGEYYTYTCTGPVVTNSSSGGADGQVYVPLVITGPSVIPAPGDGPHINNNYKERNDIWDMGGKEGTNMQAKRGKEKSDIRAKRRTILSKWNNPSQA